MLESSHVCGESLQNQGEGYILRVTPILTFPLKGGRNFRKRVMRMNEVQLDGLIGPTHFFGGLAGGNVASITSAGKVSHPRAAALQGLKKMKAVHDLGVMQLVIPPHPRPAFRFLENIGFSGNAEEKIAAVSKDAPHLLPIIYSSSAMWAANAATSCASVDAADGKVHFTPANLISNAHRVLEADFTATMLRKIFHGDVFEHHAPLPYNPMLADEGAANHMRLQNKAGQAFHVFVYGEGATKKYAPRQKSEASHTIARLHQLSPEYTVFLQQHPDAIDAGVFHNDVIATSNDQLLIYHEQAFVSDVPLVETLENAGGFTICKVSTSELSLAEAVKTYLFNSQILTRADGSMVILAPIECKASPAASSLIESWIAAPEHPISAVQYIDVGQSMGNGGGPACLRLRLWLNEAEKNHIHSGIIFSDVLYERLGNWVEAHYPETLTAEDLTHIDLPKRVQNALLELETIIEMRGMYDGYW